MTKAESKAALRHFLNVALPAVEALPTRQRAEAYDGIAVACRSVDTGMAQQAASTAAALREAESAQRLMHELLS